MGGGSRESRGLDEQVRLSSSSEGEAIPAPDVGGTGGSRAQRGGDAGSPQRVSCKTSSITSTSSCGGSSVGGRSMRRRRERGLESVCLIGQGSAALVYLVRCRVTESMSALKVQRKEEHRRSAERVIMERDVMVDARHPLVAPLYAAFQDRLYLYLDMEYCPGGSLDDFVGYCVQRNLTEEEARFYAAEITLGLEFLHSKGYVYRDLKAANVLVSASGHIKLTDFGIAERGKVRIETEDKMWQEPPLPQSLPRTKSSPVFAKAAPVAVPPPVVHVQRKSAYRPGPGAVSLPEERQPVDEVPPRAPGCKHRRAASSDCIASSRETCAPSSPRGDHLERASLPDTRKSAKGGGVCSSNSNSSSGSGGGYHAFFRRKQPRPKRDKLPVDEAIPPRPPGLGGRMRNSLRRSSKRPTSATSRSSCACSDLPGVPNVGGAPAMTVCTVGESHTVAGDDAPLFDGQGVASVLQGPMAKPDEQGRETALLHSGEVSLRTRPRSPLATDADQPKTRQSSVELSEACWGLLSGSPEYMAPEVLLHDAQGSAVDWWGLGILTYELLFGRTPFVGEKGKTRFTYLNIMHKQADFPEPGQNGAVSVVCQEFIHALLAKDPRGRAGSRGAHAVKAHPFLSGVRWDQLLTEEPPLQPGRLGTDSCSRPPPVDNTSGWWWDVEEAVAVEDEELRENRQRKTQCSSGIRDEATSWWPFDGFDWTEDSI